MNQKSVKPETDNDSEIRMIKSDSASNDQALAQFTRQFDALQNNIETFIRGKSEVVRMALVCLLAEGHLLINDRPGTGKTSLAKALARSISGTMQRIQFTPDLMPSDVTGSQVLQGDSGRGGEEGNADPYPMSFRKGPVFANVVLADEINRASPKTQSALLEVMDEAQVTMGRKTYPVPRPFFVIATQNPFESDGTYRLPIAELDRFTMQLSMGYPSREHEIELVDLRRSGATVEQSVQAIAGMGPESISSMITLGRRVKIKPEVLAYIVDICRATRESSYGLRLGVSPRGTLALTRAAQIFAASRSRFYVTADDVKDVARSVLLHRIVASRNSMSGMGQDGASILDQILESIEVPGIHD